jgi:hypothetical protein
MLSRHSLASPGLMELCPIRFGLGTILRETWFFYNALRFGVLGSSLSTRTQEIGNLADFETRFLILLCPPCLQDLVAADPLASILRVDADDVNVSVVTRDRRKAQVPSFSFSFFSLHFVWVVVLLVFHRIALLCS